MTTKRYKKKKYDYKAYNEDVNKVEDEIDALDKEIKEKKIAQAKALKELNSREKKHKEAQSKLDKLQPKLIKVNEETKARKKKGTHREPADRPKERSPRSFRRLPKRTSNKPLPHASNCRHKAIARMVRMVRSGLGTFHASRT